MYFSNLNLVLSKNQCDVKLRVMIKLLAKNNFLFTKVISFFLLITFVLFFSLYKLEKSPPIWYDEGIYNQVAINIANHFKYKIQIAPSEFADTSLITGGYPFLLPIAFSFKLFGISLLNARLVMVLFMLLLGIMSFSLIRKLFGTRQGILALLLLVSFPVLYGVGKGVLGEVPGMFFLVTFFYILEKIRISPSNKNSWLYVLAGLFSGLSVATKPFFLILIPITILLFGLYRKENRNYFDPVKIIIFGLVFFVMMFIWLATQFGVNSSFHDVIRYYANPYGHLNILDIVIKNFISFFSETTPLYLLIIMIIWLFSLIVRYIKKIPITFIEFGIFMFSIITCLTYLRMASWYRYLFPAQVFSLLFLPSSLQFSYDYVTNKIEILKKIKIIPIVITVVVGINIYSLLFNSWVANHYNNNRNITLKKYFEKIDKEKSLFLYNTPVIPLFLKNDNYYQFIRPTESILIGQNQLAKIKKHVPDMIVVYEKEYSRMTDFFYPYIKKDTIGEYVILQQTNK